MSEKTISPQERQRRWRLLLGKDADQLSELNNADKSIDRLLEQLYQPGEAMDGERYGSLGGRRLPRAASWFGKIRDLFPQSAVSLIQKDAMQRLDVISLLSDPEFLNEVKADIHLVAMLLELKDHIPEAAKENARRIVRQLVEQLLLLYRAPVEQSIRGALNRAARNRRPRPSEVNWGATIRKNLATWQPQQQIIFPERLVGYGRKQRRATEIVLCVDQSGSMATSVIYSSIFAAVIASIPALKTRLVVFDTEVVDLTAELQDPVDLLFGIQLGGGTDIAKAMQYCEAQMTSPADTVLILISDLYEGGDSSQLLATAKRLKDSGVNLVTLLALSDDGRPSFDHRMAASFTALGSPAFACTPDLFPALTAVALERRDLHQFASANNLPVVFGEAV